MLCARRVGGSALAVGYRKRRWAYARRCILRQPPHSAVEMLGRAYVESCYLFPDGFPGLCPHESGGNPSNAHWRNTQAGKGFGIRVAYGQTPQNPLDKPRFRQYTHDVKLSISVNFLLVHIEVRRDNRQRHEIHKQQNMRCRTRNDSGCACLCSC